jgi:hypothetical protein
MTSAWYSSLDPNNEIRHLKICPASSFDDALVCSIERKTLKDADDFDALSYVWGEEASAERLS